jgi:hypothetical protein
MRARFLYCLASLLVVVGGCAATQTDLVNLWIDSNRAEGAPERVLVVAQWQDHDARVLWEERFAQALEHNHTRATPSYTEMPAPMPDSTTVFTEARNHGYDAVIVIHRHVLDRNSFYLPGYTLPRHEKVPRWFKPTGGTEVWTGASAAGWSSLECDVELWSPADRAGMVWSGTGEVAYPGSDDYAAYSIAGTVVSELERLGLVPARL